MAWGAPPIKAPAGKTGGFGYKVPGALRGAKPNAGPRQSAIAHHMGAPKQQQSTTHKVPQRPPKAPPGHKGGGGGGKPAGGGLGSSQKAIGELNQGDVVNRARTEARLARNAELVPLQAQANEIKGNEAGVQANYAKLVGGENEQFQKIGEQQAASAKTFQNQMAENALQQGKAIETAGQTGASMTGGYASPELRAQLMGEAQLAGQQGGAGNQFAQNVATTGAANIANMRGAAALNALGGSQAVSNVFQKQLAANQTAQQGVAAKTGLREVEGRTKLEQANFADKATRQKLEAEHLYKKEYLGQKENASKRTANTAKAGRELKSEEGKANRQQKLEFHEQTITDKLKKAAEKRSGKKGTSAQQQKFLSELGSAAARVQTLRSGEGKIPDQKIREAISSGQRTTEVEVSPGKWKPRTIHEKAVGNQAIVNAALEVWNPPHKISPQTRRELTAAGYKPGSDAELYMELYRGKVPNSPSGVTGGVKARK